MAVCDVGIRPPVRAGRFAAVHTQQERLPLCASRWCRLCLPDRSWPGFVPSSIWRVRWHAAERIESPCLP